MLNRQFVRCTMFKSPRFFKPRLDFHLFREFAQQNTPKIINIAHNNHQSSNSDNGNVKKNVDFMNFQAFIEKMKVFFLKLILKI